MRVNKRFEYEKTSKNQIIADLSTMYMQGKSKSIEILKKIN